MIDYDELPLVVKRLGEDDEDTFEVVLNVGASSGVKLGDRYQVFGLGEEILDPRSNESLGLLEVVRGVGSVVHLQERIATLRTAKSKKLPKDKRTVTKRSGSRLHLMAIGADDEVVVEEGEDRFEEIPFKNVREGDFARPV